MGEIMADKTSEMISNIQFQRIDQLPKDTIFLTCSSLKSYYIFRIGSEIFAVSPDTFELLYCKKTLLEPSLHPSVSPSDMFDCIDEYCRYYYVKDANSFSEYSIPSRYNSGYSISSDAFVYQCSSKKYYLIYLNRYTVSAMDIQTGYHYECETYVRALKKKGYQSTPFHSDMRECNSEAVRVYKIPKSNDSRIKVPWMNERAKAWMGNKYGESENGCPIPDDATEFECLSGQRYVIYYSVDELFATDLSTRKTYWLDDTHDVSFKEKYPEIAQDLKECSHKINSKYHFD